ncbi:MAG TPA: DEAD/DEAH box helicase [Dokdonella sp.]|uniref:DEAD/DEAH box helicase n=1 Tax=Dokdonella sp. TaxID=2291710 RepID=UPI002B9EA689|nr:DEAD/DEAH box helicase [Xanthomonadales bacterium]MBL0223522.1 DEAD/DEAH box helicase [Xanthomonadales bacterium]HQW77167.1 DEAD/DEAH box helicase [Dokdonella sp.]HQY55234.1 DEAD/DEAH box helicase [Dokdonella sp.]HQZ61635.1 DEAD/DEAH box helicase [Dokdonella sp.]
MSDPATQVTPVISSFKELALGEPLQRVLADVGYESPSPIQAATIPHLLAGKDVLGQAQTGTGKTAAFALPILDRLDLRKSKPQALVLAPTRELAIQVAEAFQRYATHIPGFRVLPIYGGQAYGPQLGGLRRGVHVVVGTPGRVIDHLERGSLDLSELSCLVLDEADEMLRMGFIDDVEAVLKKTPPTRQIALFSATMPTQIRRIAQNHLREPVEITIKSKTTTAAKTRQRYWLVSGMHKLDALTRILEAEPFDAMIIFTRTKVSTEELAERLQARGLAAAAINGDLAQAQRERAIQQLKDGKLDILVATDVAARGLDVDRISHVLNYDIPYDTESYVHRIGRTGRAGREGDAILFVTPRERNMLRQIERATRQPIEMMDLPSVETVNDRRITRFKDRITTALAASDLAMFRSVIEQYESEHDVPAIEIAAALARLAQGDKPLLLDAKAKPERREFDPTASRERKEFATREERGRDARPPRSERPERAERSERPRADRPPHPRAARTEAFSNPAEDGRKRSMETREPRAHAHAASEHRPPEAGMETFRVEVGHMHGVKPGNIVGAIANEAELDSKHIGRITIHEDHSLVDLPVGMPSEILQLLKKSWVAGQRLRISRGTAGEPHAVNDESSERSARPPRPAKPMAQYPSSGPNKGKPRKKY